MSDLSIEGKLSGHTHASHASQDRENEEYKSEIVTTEFQRGHLKEIFDYCSVGKPDSLGFYEFCEGLKHLQIKVSELVITQAFWRRIEDSPGLSRKEISFEEFCELVQELKEISHQNKRFAIDYNVMAFKGDGNFVMMKDKELKYVETQPEDDQIKLFMRRIEKGYGLNPEVNIRVLEELEHRQSEGYVRKGQTERRANLKDFWEFILKCQVYRKEKEQNIPKLLVDPVNGINSFINLHHEELRANPIRIFDHYVLENDERAKGLQICGWTELKCFDENEQLNRICQKLEDSGQGFRAIALAIFHFDFILAFQIMTRISDPKNDRSQRYLAESGNELNFLREILIGLNNVHILLRQSPELKRMFMKPEKDWENNSSISMELPSQEQLEHIMKYNLLEINESTVAELQHQKSILGKYYLINHTMVFLKNLCKNAEFNHPFLHSICKFISFENFGQSNYILEDVEISFFDRIGFALRFLNTTTLTQFIENYLTLGEMEGLLEVMIITGKSERSMNFIRTYLDKYNDIQTVGLASILLRFLKFPDEARIMHWLRNYKEILNRLQLWDTRILLDKKFQEIELLMTERTKNPVSTRCSSLQDEVSNNVTEKLGFCACSLSHENSTLGALRKESQFQTLLVEKTRIFDCSKCLKPASNCDICLLPVTVPNTYIEQEKNKRSSKKQLELLSDTLNFEEAMVWCQNCKHGGHFSHMMEWFLEFTTCAVTDCPCECSML